MDTIGKRIKYLRDELNISQQEIAGITGISRGNISNYERLTGAEKESLALIEQGILCLSDFYFGFYSSAHILNCP